ncbi:MAG TPA: magnesium/cobalt transporter CorA [Bacteroidales bacterium]|nr:magnesium/cobalt transporter CorA [Bacteroidales bacterium]HPS16422.1 magnesium/cobalt transporter CorA [Bacteroidales bacterium]
MKHKKHKPTRKTIQKIRFSQKAGMPPGSIVHVGAENKSDVKLTLIYYTNEFAEMHILKSVEECNNFIGKEGKVWLNVDGIHNINIIEGIGKIFNLHPLVLEDIPNTELRPRFEEFDNYIFFTMKGLEYNKAEEEIKYEQISFVFGEKFVLSFQENESTLFNSITERMLSGVSKALGKGTDYLMYLLIDATVDNYFEITEVIEENIEILEDDVLLDTTGKSLAKIQKTRRGLVVLMKSVFPLREAIGKMQRRENPIIHEGSYIFFSNIYDHAIHIIDSIETQRDILAGLMDIYLSNISNRMNSVMKVLTIIATIFIPITFFAGVYGMNFKNIPELGWGAGYAFFWLLCLACVGMMIIYFKRKKWL